MEKKREAAVPYTGYPYGWIAPNQEALAASKGDVTPPNLRGSLTGDHCPFRKILRINVLITFAINPLYGRTLLDLNLHGLRTIRPWNHWQNALCRPSRKH